MRNTMTDKKKTSEEPAPQGHHHDELAEVKQFIETYGKPAVTALLVVMIAIGAFQMYTTRKQNRIDESARQLAAARSIPDFEAVYANYGKTKAAPRALLAAAKLYYDNANYEIAIAKYEEFLREFPEDRMVSTAELGRIFCIEARNYNAAIEEASAAYAAFAVANPDSFLAPQAIFGQARCLEQLGKLDEARAIYEDFIAKQAESAWVIRAEDLLEQVTLQIEKQQSAETVTTPATVPAAPTIAIPAAAPEKPAEEPVKEEPVVEAAVQEKPVEAKPAAEPVKEKPVAVKPAQEKPAAEAPAAEKPAKKEPPVAKKPAAEKPAKKKPVVEKPATEKPAAEKPAEKKRKKRKKKPLPEAPARDTSVTDDAGQ